MKNMPTSVEINQLTSNTHPDEVWAKAVDIVRRISPAYEFNFVRPVFVDVIMMFHGEFPGYSAIKTPYHNMHHTLDVFLCSVRLMHGVHLSGVTLSDDELTLIMLATLLHDIGYAQREEEDSGTGAQYTLTHVDRGIVFMRQYLQEQEFPPTFAAPLAYLMGSTNPAQDFKSVQFPDARTRMLSQIVGSADIVGQMADRTYLEKLLFLYLEFKEARFGNYANMHDLLRQTKTFYENTRLNKLEGSFEGVYKKLALHFADYLGVERNLYIESIEKNIAYLEKIISLNESEYLSMLKRGGIIEQSQNLLSGGMAG